MLNNYSPVRTRQFGHCRTEVSGTINRERSASVETYLIGPRKLSNYCMPGWKFNAFQVITIEESKNNQFDIKVNTYQVFQCWAHVNLILIRRSLLSRMVINSSLGQVVVAAREPSRISSSSLMSDSITTRRCKKSGAIRAKSAQNGCLAVMVNPHT